MTMPGDLDRMQCAEDIFKELFRSQVMYTAIYCFRDKYGRHSKYNQVVAMDEFFYVAVDKMDIERLRRRYQFAVDRNFELQTVLDHFDHFMKRAKSHDLDYHLIALRGMEPEEMLEVKHILVVGDDDYVFDDELRMCQNTPASQPEAQLDE
jgi:hypothetical protein